jgi:hypothetical protein
MTCDCKMHFMNRSRGIRTPHFHSYAPFFVLSSAAVAQLPYIWGYLVWTFVSILLIFVGYVDVGAAVRPVTGHPSGVLRFTLLAAALPLLWLAWNKIGAAPLSWALAVTCTLFLNVYSPIYDCTMLILVVMWAGPGRIGTPLLLAFFFATTHERTAGKSHWRSTIHPRARLADLASLYQWTPSSSGMRSKPTCFHHRRS